MSRRAWATAARAALVLVGVSPLLVAFARARPLLGALISPFDAWFAFQCERDPARALPWPAGLPVCSRCLGIYVGLGLGAALLRPRLAPAQLRLWVGVAVAVMAVDVATEFFGMRPALSALRFATGLALAYPVGAALVWALRGSSAQGLRTART